MSAGQETSIFDLPQHTDNSTGLVYVLCGAIYFQNEIDESVAYDVGFELADSDVEALDLSNTTMVGGLRLGKSSNSHVTLSQLDTSTCSHLKKIICDRQELTSLDISSNYKLEYLKCQYNHIANTSALERWLAVSGHYGAVSPQRLSSPAVQQAQKLPVSMDQQVVLSIPETANGADVPLIGGMSLALDLDNVPVCSQVFDDGSFRVAIGSSNNFSPANNSRWDSFKKYVSLDCPTELDGGLVTGLLQSENYSATLNYPPGGSNNNINVSGSMYGYLEGRIVGDGLVATSSRGMLSFSQGFEFTARPFLASLGNVFIRLNLNASLRVSGDMDVDGSGGLSVGIAGAEVVFPDAKEGSSDTRGGDRMSADYTLYSETVEIGSFNDMEPRIVATASGDRVLVWTSVVSGRTAGNNTAVVYSVWDDVLEEWSSPEIVDDDGTADFYPSVAVDGDTVWVAWTNSNSDSLTASSTLPDVAATCETEVAAIDVSTGTVTNWGLTTDTVADVRPCIAACEGEILVAWLCNPANDLVGLSGTNKVMRAPCTPGANPVWSSSTVFQGATPVGGVACGQIGDSLSYSEGVAWVQANADGTTSLKVSTGATPVTVAQGGPSAVIGSVQFANPSGSGFLTWCKEGSVWLWGGSGNASTLCGIPSDDFKIVGIGGQGYYVVASGPSATGEGEGALYAYHVPTTFAGTSAFIEKGGYVNAFDATFDDGALIVASAVANAQIGQSGVMEATQLDIDGVSESAVDLSLDAIDFNFAQAKPNTGMLVKLTVTNHGLSAVSRIGFELSCGGSSTSAQPQFTILPGETKMLSTAITMPSSITSETTLSATVSPYGATDADASDNSASVAVGYSDLAVTASQGAEGSISCTVSNRGGVPASARLEVREPDGGLLEQYPLGSVSVGGVCGAFVHVIGPIRMGSLRGRSPVRGFGDKRGRRPLRFQQHDIDRAVRQHLRARREHALQHGGGDGKPCFPKRGDLACSRERVELCRPGSCDGACGGS